MDGIQKVNCCEAARETALGRFRPFESNQGPPQKRRFCGEINHVKYHMDEREIVAEYLES